MGTGGRGSARAGLSFAARRHGNTQQQKRNKPRLKSKPHHHQQTPKESDTVYVTDLNSTNGTMVNGVELSPMDNVAVDVGQEITFGDWHLARFQLDLVAPAADGAAAGGAVTAAAAAAGGAGGGQQQQQQGRRGE